MRAKDEVRGKKERKGKKEDEQTTTTTKGLSREKEVEARGGINPLTDFEVEEEWEPSERSGVADSPIPLMHAQRYTHSFIHGDSSLDSLTIIVVCCLKAFCLLF